MKPDEVTDLAINEAEHLISSEEVAVSTPSFEEALNHTINQFRQAFTNLAKDD